MWWSLSGLITERITGRGRGHPVTPLHQLPDQPGPDHSRATCDVDMHSPLVSFALQTRDETAAWDVTVAAQEAFSP